MMEPIRTARLDSWQQRDGEESGGPEEQRVATAADDG